jgi:hypothetical protein
VSKIILVAVIYLALLSHSFGSATCLTHSEARQLWPRQHIYWYSSDHCWSNRRGGPPRNLRYDLIRENHAESLSAPTDKDAGKGTAPPNAARRSAVPTTVLYPSLQQMMRAIEPSLLDRSELTLSYRLLDIDELTSQIPDPPECCWPELVKDTNGEWVLK